MKAAFDKWAVEHPFTAIGFCMAIAAVGVFDIIADNGTVAVLSFFTYVFLLIAWGLIIWLDCKKTLSVLIALSLFTLPASAQERPRGAAGPIACAVVVLAVGTVVVVKLIQCINKVYSKTNAPSEEFYLSASAPGDSAAADVFFCGYCYSPDLGLQPNSLLPETIISGTVSGNSISISVVTNVGTRADFLDEMAALGLPMQPGRHYAKNGRPAQQWDVPILFPQERGEVPHVIVTGNNPQTTVVFRSFDLVTWVPILTNTIPSGMTSRFEDNTAPTSGSAFYRVRNL